MRLQSIYPKLNGQPVGKGRLTGGGGTRDKNKFHVFALRNLLCNLSNLPFLVRLLHQHHFPHIILGHHVVERSHRVNLLLVAPLHGFFEHLEQFRAWHERRYFLRLLFGRHLDDKSILIQM